MSSPDTVAARSARAPGPSLARLASPAPTSLGTAGLVTVLSGTFLAMVDFFVVNVALPSIDAELHASSAELELVVAGYGIAYALLLVLGGRLGDAFGRRRLFRAGMAAFTVTSLACGLAPDAGVLVVSRVLQGTAAAMMVPQVLATIQASTEGIRRARAIGLYGATGGLAAVVGQVAGGALVSADLAGSGWRPIFLVNVPIGLAGVLAARRYLPDTRADAPTGIDHAGTGLLAATLVALLLPAVEGRQFGWPSWLLALLALAPFLALAFAAAQRRLERDGGVPLLPPSLLAVPTMRAGLLAAIPFFTGFGGFMFVYALAEHAGGRGSPLATGLGIAPMGVAFLATSLGAVRLVSRYGPRVLVVGALVQCAGLLGIAAVLASRPLLASPAELAPLTAVLGAGQGLVMSPLFRLALAQVPAHRAGVASGLLVTVQQVSLALGVATLGGLFLATAGPGRLGVRAAFGTVVVVQAGLAVVVAAALVGMARRTPTGSPGRG